MTLGSRTDKTGHRAVSPYPLYRRPQMAQIPIKFGLDPSQNILEILQQISNLRRGDELVKALNKKEIACEIFTWES